MRFGVEHLRLGGGLCQQRGQPGARCVEHILVAAVGAAHQLGVIQLGRAAGRRFQQQPPLVGNFAPQPLERPVEGQPPVTFRESYSDWRVIQEVLVATRRKLRQNGELVQTIDLMNAQYGVAYDDVTFLQL